MMRTSCWLALSVMLLSLLLIASCGGDGGSKPVGDTIAPAVTHDLAVESATLAGIALRWTAPGDDGTIGTASQYDLRYSKTPITSSNWDSAAVASPAPAPTVAGTTQQYVVAGLPAGTWYFALRAADEVPNWSGLSNVVSAVMPAVSPFRVTDLAAVASTGGTATLEWTAPGEEVPPTPATAYDLRYALAAITDDNWEQASRVLGLPVPAPRGTRESFTVTSLGPETTYFFAVKAEDGEGHWSDLSNVATRATAALSYVRLTHSSRSDGASSATWSSDNENIVFAADWGGKFFYQLYRVPASGGDPVALTNIVGTGLGGAYLPSLSPDGAKLAFVSMRSEEGTLFYDLSTMDSSPGAVPIVLATYRLRSVGRPSWSPDGTRIAYHLWSLSSPRAAEIYTISAAGGTPVLLTSAAVNGTQPAWSPDGTRIAFSSNLSPYGIRVMPAAGGDAVQLTTGTAAEGGQSPAWSPDGTHIAFSSVQAGSADIWVMSSSGANPTRLTTSPDRETSPSWSPDGRAIAVTRVTGSGQSQVQDIWVLHL